MSKRILAMLLSMLLVISAFVMSGCKAQDNDAASDSQADDSSVSAIEGDVSNPDSASKLDLVNGTAKDIFMVSLNNAMADMFPEDAMNSLFNPDAGVTKAQIDALIEMDLVINKLNIQGQDVIGGNPVKAEVEFLSDNDNKAIQATVGLDMFGENPAASAIITENAIYITDLLGVDSDVLYMEIPEDALTGADSFVTQLPFSVEDLKAMVEVLKKATEDNIVTDDAFSKENKSVTVDGVEFENACVVTLSVSADAGKTLVEDVVNGIFDIDSIKTWLEETYLTDADELKAELLNDLAEGDIPEQKFVCTLDKDGNIIGLDYIIEDPDSDDSFKLEIVSVNGNFKLKLGEIKDGSFSNYFFVEYSFDGATKAEKFVFGMLEIDQQTEYVTIEGTVDGNNRTGVATLNIDGEKYAFKYSLETKENAFSFKITEVSFPSNGVTVAIPLEVTVYGSATDTEVKAGIAAKVNITGVVDIDVSMDFVTALADSTIDIPTEYVNVEDVTEEDAAQWVTDIQAKYPMLMSLLEGFMGSMQPAPDDDSYDDDYYGDDYYDDDVYYN